MENNIALQAKQALTNFYQWVIDHQPFHKTEQSSSVASTVSSAASKAASLASSFVDSYLNPSHTQQHPAEHSLYLHYQPPHHHSTVDSSSSTCGTGDHHNPEGSSSSCYTVSDNPIIAFFQSLTHPNYRWKSWDPVTSFDSALWNYTPDIHTLQKRFLSLVGLGGMSEKYNIDSWILVVVVVILGLAIWGLIVCFAKRARKSSEDGPRSPGKKTDPMLVGSGGASGNKKTGKSGSGSKQHQEAGGSSTSGASLTKRGSKKKDGPSDAGSSQYLLGADNGISSWSARLGSMGFYGGETLDYKPLDIFASMNEGTKTSSKNLENENSGTEESSSVVESMNALGSEMMKRLPFQHILDQDIAQLLGSDFLDSDNQGDEDTSVDKNLGQPVDSADHSKAKAASRIAASGSDSLKGPAASGPSVDSVKSRKAPGSSAKAKPTNQLQKQEREQNEPGQHMHKQEKNAGRQSGQGPAGPDTPPLRTRAPRPSGSFKESDRPKVQHHSIHTSDATAGASAKPTGNVGRDLGSKVFGFVQNSQLLKNMDSISGGLLGSAVATVVALASTAEATAGVIKNNLPGSVADFTDELRESFDHAMRVQDSDTEESNKKAWGVRDAISKIMQDDESNDNVTFTQTHATTHANKPIPSAVATGTVRVPLSSEGSRAPASTPVFPSKPPTTALKQHPDEDISSRTTRSSAPRNVDITEGYVLSSVQGEKENKTNSRSSSGRTPMSEEALTQVDMSLSQELSSPSAQKAPSTHREHEDEDYYLEDMEDSGEEADNDEEEGREGEVDEGDDTDTFVLAESLPPPAAKSSHVDISELSELVHPHDELVDSESSDSTTGGSIADDELPPTLSTTASSDTLSKVPVQVQVLTVDAHGNKVPVSTEARRDSGFDLLVD